MSKPAVPALDALFLKLARLAVLAPDEFQAVEVLVTAALKRHQDTDRKKQAGRFARVK